jgi:hypothetical protein
MNDLRELLYSVARRLTQSPIGCKGFSRVSSTPDSGLKITTQISIEKFKPLCSEKDIDNAVAEMEKDYSPDLGVWRDLKYVYFSKFITEGGPWIEEIAPGVRFIYEVGSPIVGQIDQKALKRSQEQSSRQTNTQGTNNGFVGGGSHGENRNNSAGI